MHIYPGQRRLQFTARQHHAAERNWSSGPLPSTWDSSRHCSVQQPARTSSAAGGGTDIITCHGMQSGEGAIKRVPKPGGKGRRRPDRQSTAAEAQDAEDDAPTAPQPLAPRGRPKLIPTG